MTPADLIATALLLGLYVLAGGCYGSLYGAAMLRSSRRLMQAAHACYVVQLVLTAVVWAYTPLEAHWKLLIVASTIGYFYLPVVTWRYMKVIHRSGEQTR
jgi:hypothetical protein